MATAVPPIYIPDGHVAYCQNYLLGEDGYKLRRGFEKLNPRAIPFPGARLDGAGQYLEVIDAYSTQGSGAFSLPFNQSHVIEIAFVLEDMPVNATQRMFLLSYGQAGATEGIAHRWAIEVLRDANELIQVRFRTSTTTITTVFTDSGPGIKSGIGYRVSFIHDDQISATDGRLLVFRQGTDLPIANVSGSILNFTGKERLLLGRSLLNTLTGTDGYFAGIIQDFRFWNYGDASPGVIATPAAPAVTDAIVVRSNVELDTVDAADSDLQCWIRADHDDNEDGVLEDLAGNGFDAVNRPAPPRWVSPGLVDNAPETFCPLLDPVDSQFIRIYDRPSAVGGSIFNAFGQNSAYEFSLSFAVELDGDYINRLKADSAAPDWLPLVYYGNDKIAGSLYGEDISAAGNYGLVMWLENVGTTSNPDYRPRAQLCGDTLGRKILTPSNQTVAGGTRYRIDLIRDNRWFWYRVYEDGENWFASSGEERRVDIDSITPWTTEVLRDPYGASPWTDGQVFLFGTVNDAGDQRYFPGKFDDIRIFSTNAERVHAEYNISLHPWDDISAIDNKLLFRGRLNEGSGRYLTDSSSYRNNLPSVGGTEGELHEMMPASARVEFGAGWIAPSQYNEASGIRAYKDIETGGETLFVAAGGALWTTPAKFGDRTVLLSPIYHGLESGRQVSWANLNNQLIIANGLNDNLRYDGKSMSPLGLPQPTQAPGAVGAGGSGVLPGTYLYYYRWKNSKTGGVSNLSPASAAHVITAAEDVRVTYFVPNIASGLAALAADTVEILRTLAGGATPYVVGFQRLPDRSGSQAQVASLVYPPFTDNTPDGQVSRKTAVTSLTAYSALPKCKYVIAARSRLFGFGIDAYPNRLVWCELHYPDHHDPITQYSDGIDSGDGDELSGGYFWNDVLWLFQRRQIWNVLGVDDDRTLTVVHRFSGIGCAAHETIQNVGGFLIWRGEDQFYRMTAGSSQPEPIGDPIKNLLELIDPTQVRYETSGVLRQEGLYLCAVTSEIGRVIDSRVRNDYVFAYNVFRRQWYLLETGSVAAFENVELGGFSELFALMRNGFIYRYSGLGNDSDTAGIRQHTYKDGLARDERSNFTLAADVANDDRNIDLLESADVYTDGDGMKGLKVQWVLDDGTLSGEYIVRKHVTVSGSPRLHLCKPVSEASTSKIGMDVYVGGYTGLIQSRYEHFGRPGVEKSVSGLFLVTAATGVTPAPSRAPAVTEATGAATLIYAYTIEIDGSEGRMSPWTEVTSAARAATVIELHAPRADLGTIVKLNLYLLIPGTHAFRRIYVHTVQSSAEIVSVTDPDTYIGDPAFVLYEPWVKSSMVRISGSQAIRGQALTEVHTNKVVDLSGDREWRIPFEMSGNLFQFEIESPFPDANHEIHLLEALVSE